MMRMSDVVENEIAVVEDTTAVSHINQLDLVDIDYAVESQKNFEGLVEALLDKDTDYQGGKKRKSAWRKLARAFNISDEPITKEIIRDENHQIISAYFEVKAILPNGRSGFGVGDCSIFDKIKYDDSELPSNFELRKRFTNAEHDVIATAHTRAKSRAISDLIGAGEVSAEEMDNPHVGSKSHKPSAPKPAKPTTAKQNTSNFGNKPKAPKPTKPKENEAIEVEAKAVEDLSEKKSSRNFKELCDSNAAISKVVKELQANERTVNRNSVMDKLMDLWDIGTVSDDEYKEAKALLE